MAAKGVHGAHVIMAKMLRPRGVAVTARPTLPRQAPVLAAQPTPRVQGRAGVALRARRLRLHPLCRQCQLEGRVSATTVIDHIVPLALGGPDTDANTQGLCDTCNLRKTEADQRLIRSLVQKS